MTALQGSGRVWHLWVGGSEKEEKGGLKGRK